jgi:hypothetical protein
MTGMIPLSLISSPSRKEPNMKQPKRNSNLTVDRMIQVSVNKHLKMRPTTMSQAFQSARYESTGKRVMK